MAIGALPWLALASAPIAMLLDDEALDVPPTATPLCDAYESEPTAIEFTPEADAPVPLLSVLPPIAIVPVPAATAHSPTATEAASAEASVPMAIESSPVALVGPL